MIIQLQDKDAKLYERLYVSSLDLDFAQYCLGVLLKKGWHHKPFERRHTVYQQQSAFTSALVTAYGRPFTQSRGWPKFPSELIDFGAEEQEMHKRMMDLRHSVYAHSDSKNYEVKPWRCGDFSTDIRTAPQLRIAEKEAVLLKGMIGKLQSSIQQKMRQICPTA